MSDPKERTNEEMLALYQEGLSYADIGKKVGLTRQGVSYRLHKIPGFKAREGQFQKDSQRNYPLCPVCNSKNTRIV